MKLNVVNVKGEDTGRKVTFSDEIFGIDPNSHSVYLDVKQYLANQRQGTAKTKERNEIAGSTRKIKKQKGMPVRKPAASRTEKSTRWRAQLLPCDFWSEGRSEDWTNTFEPVICLTDYNTRNAAKNGRFAFSSFRVQYF